MVKQPALARLWPAHAGARARRKSAGPRAQGPCRPARSHRRRRGRRSFALRDRKSHRYGRSAATSGRGGPRSSLSKRLGLHQRRGRAINGQRDALLRLAGVAFVNGDDDRRPGDAAARVEIVRQSGTCRSARAHAAFRPRVSRTGGLEGLRAWSSAGGLRRRSGLAAARRRCDTQGCWPTDTRSARRRRRRSPAARPTRSRWCCAS